MNINESLHSYAMYHLSLHIFFFSYEHLPEKKVGNANPHVPPHVPIWLHESVNISLSSISDSLHLLRRSLPFFLLNQPTIIGVSYPTSSSALVPYYTITLVFFFKKKSLPSIPTRLRLNITPRLGSAFPSRPFSALRLLPRVKPRGFGNQRHCSVGLNSPTPIAAKDFWKVLLCVSWFWHSNYWTVFLRATATCHPCPFDHFGT